jgi:hypothetical protein
LSGLFCDERRLGANSIANLLVYHQGRMSALLSSPRFVRRASWLAGLVLLAGVVAFGVAYFGDSGSGSANTPLRPNEPVPNPTPTTAPARSVPLPKAARVVAGEFVLTAVTRENLAKAWKLVDPQSVLRDCGGHRCTYKEWLSGNIPVQPYPAKALDKASFSIEESYPDFVVLQVALLPKDGADVEGQIFWISLKKVKGHWLVDEWSPRVIVSVPQAESG